MVRIVSVGGLARRAAAALPALAIATTGVAFAAGSAGPDTSDVSQIVVPEDAITEPASPSYPLAGPAPAPMQLPPIYDTYLSDPSRRAQSVEADQALTAIGRFLPVRLDANGIPANALAAYRLAADLLGRLDPGCGIDWALLGAIGRVESNHARFGGNALDTAGIAQPGIIGIALDGSRGTSHISDTDGGRWDRDGVYDRAVGPMQFIPGTWRISGRDGDGDGIANPQDMVDAATAAGVYLCSGSGNLTSSGDAYNAVMRYNHSDDYARSVLAIADAYRTGVAVLPVGAIPAARPASGSGSDTPDGSGFGWGGSSASSGATGTSGGSTPPSSGSPTTPTSTPTATATGTATAKPTSTSGSGTAPKPTPTSTSTPVIPGLPLPLPSLPLPLPTLPLPSPTSTTLTIAQLLALPPLPPLLGDPAGLIRVLNPLTGALTCILDNQLVTCPGLLG